LNCRVVGGGVFAAYGRRRKYQARLMSTLLQTGSPTQAVRFEALLRASKAIASSGDCGKCEEVFARELRSAIAFDYLHVSMFESDRGSSCNSGWRLFDIHGSKRQIPEADLPVDEIELMSSLVHEDGQPLVVADWSKEARFPQLKVFITGLGINSTCALPLVRGQRRLGVFEVGSTQPNAYCNEEVAFLSFAADQVALSIDAAVNFAVSQQAQERLKLLLELTNQVVSNLELRELLRAASASLRRVMNCDVVGVMLPHSDGQQLQIYALDFPDGKGLFREESLIPIEGSHPGEVFRTGKPLLKKQPELEEERSPEHHRRVVGEGVHAGCLLPLISRGRTLGVLALGRRLENAFDEDEVEFLCQVASQVAIAVENALAYGEIADLRDKLAQEKLYLEDEIRGEIDFEGIVGQSSALRQVLQLVDTVAPSDSTVLLFGETGTGKELIARAIHDRSRRKDRTLVKLNCAAIPTGLLESELFGHERGAFTGAIAQKIGRFELADQGTLFLDEVGDIPLELQPKLLRALQEREFERLGSTRTKKVDVRLVAATNRNLEKMIAEDKFRSDLYYRLNVFPIQIPPLRERPEDIPLLVRYFAQKYARRMEKEIESVPAASMKKLTRWHWPGNIRELENLIERAVILTRGSALEVPVSDLGNGSAEKAVAQMPDAGLRDQLLRILKETRGRVGGAEGAAARLGLKRTTLLSRMKKLGIDPRAVS
jgi:formate hydrogenlyase transcriptional activator